MTEWKFLNSCARVEDELSRFSLAGCIPQLRDRECSHLSNIMQLNGKSHHHYIRPPSKTKEEFFPLCNIEDFAFFVNNATNPAHPDVPEKVFIQMRVEIPLFSSPGHHVYFSSSFWYLHSLIVMFFETRFREKNNFKVKLMYAFDFRSMHPLFNIS